MAQHKTFWKEFWRTVKYFLVAGSAGLIQMGVCTLMDLVLHIPYWIAYLTALVLSVLWNFTINRKATFRSVGNIPKAMLKVVAYYCVFTPLSLQFTYYWEKVWLLPTTICTVILILINGITEYLFMRLFVFRKEIDSAVKVKEENETAQPQEDNNN